MPSPLRGPWGTPLHPHRWKIIPTSPLWSHAAAGTQLSSLPLLGFQLLLEKFISPLPACLCVCIVQTCYEQQSGIQSRQGLQGAHEPATWMQSLDPGPHHRDGTPSPCSSYLVWKLTAPHPSHDPDTQSPHSLWGMQFRTTSADGN